MEREREREREREKKFKLVSSVTMSIFGLDLKHVWKGKRIRKKKLVLTKIQNSIFVLLKEPGVNFINVLCTAFALVGPESVKNIVKSISVF